MSWTSENIIRHEKAIQILKDARELISVPGQWVRNYLALDKQGNAVRCADDEACAWCAIGAVNRFASIRDEWTASHLVHDTLSKVALQVLEEFGDANHDSFLGSKRAVVTYVNDNLGLHATIRMLDGGILKLQEDLERLQAFSASEETT